MTNADEAFEYSSLVALPDGNIGLLWDDKGTPVVHPGIPAQQAFIAFKLLPPWNASTQPPAQRQLSPTAMTVRRDAIDVAPPSSWSKTANITEHEHRLRHGPAVVVSSYTSGRIYHSKQTPGYTSWVGLWSLPNGTIQTNFVEATGCCAHNATFDFPVLSYTGGGLNWTVAAAREAPVGYSRGMAILPGDGKSMVRPALSSGADMLHFGPDGHLANPHNNFVSVQYSRDFGQSWSTPAPIIQSPSRWQNCLPLNFHALRDGRVVGMAGMTLANVSAAMAPANMQKFMFVGELTQAGLRWGKPLPLMTIEEGVCEESDFVELPSGDLFFMHRVQHYDAAGKYVSQDYRQSRVLRQGTDFVPQPPTKPPFANQGFPCLLLTRDQKVLLDLNLFGSHYSLDLGQTWHDLELQSGQQLKTHYYPRATQAMDGTIVVTSHDRSDDLYRGYDEEIWMQSFRLSDSMGES